MIMIFEKIVIMSILFFLLNGRSDAAGNQNSSKEIEIKAFPGIYGSNCFVVSLDKCGIIIDAGLIDSSMAPYIRNKNIKIKYIFCTHSHIDHVLFAMDIKQVTGAMIALHSADVNHCKYYTPERIDEWIKSGELTKERMPYVEKFMNIKYDTLLSGGEIFQISDMRIEIIYTPGHSKGSICILVNGKYLFVGDTIYNDHIGNTDIDTGNDLDIVKSLKEKILQLNDSLIVYQGHGDSKILKELKLKLAN